MLLSHQIVMTENSDYKRAYERQKAAREKAEHLLETRSRELFDSNETLTNAFNDLKNQKEQMVQQEKLASIGLLAAGVAHEINNPMGFIRSNLETLEKYLGSIQLVLAAYETLGNQLRNHDENMNLTESLDKLASLIHKHELDYISEDSVSCIKESLSGTKRVENIVRNLKDFSRTDKDERVSLSINDCIDDSISLVANEVKYKCIVKRNYADVPEIYGCAGQLHQVLINILLNSIQAFESRGEIEIETNADPENVYIDIVDNGPGFSEENLIKLFDPFFTTKGVNEGTGLGLYISHGLVQKHRGQIRAANEPGGGARITISLPIDMRASIRSASAQSNLE